MLLLLAILAAVAWLVFVVVAMQTLFWLVFNAEAESGRRRGATIALFALGAAVILSAMRFIISFT